jgi:hypothetical protein
LAKIHRTLKQMLIAIEEGGHTRGMTERMREFIRPMRGASSSSLSVGASGTVGLAAERAAYGAPKISFTWTEVRNSLQLATAPSACPLLRGQPTGPEHCCQIEPVHQPQLVRSAGGRRHNHLS